jgi:hypothetical protein
MHAPPSIVEHTLKSSRASSAIWWPAHSND